MFSGIVQESGLVHSVESNRECKILTIKARKILKRLRVGESVAVNGICLTVEKVFRDSFKVQIVPETIQRVNPDMFLPATQVNLEPALRMGEPLGGHFVQGHVDGIGEIHLIQTLGESKKFMIRLPNRLNRYVIEKGSIALEGVSLTIAEKKNDMFSVAIIPHTLAMTNLGLKKVRDSVNIEVDLLGKYVGSLLKSKTFLKRSVRSRNSRI